MALATAAEFVIFYDEHERLSMEHDYVTQPGPSFQRKEKLENQVTKRVASTFLFNAL